MIFRRIWERYFLKEVLKIFGLFIFCFYGLYIIIDYSSRSATHYAGKFTFLEMAKLYLFIFIQRMDILIPFALVVATVKTLCSLNVRNEIVALMSSGVKLKRLMRPFILVSLFFVGVLYVNEQFFLPPAYRQINFLKDKHNDDETREDQYKNIQSLEVIDKGQIIYHGYDNARKSFFDVYWIISLDDIYRIKYLFPYEGVPRGKFVDHFTRNEQEELLLSDTHETLDFPRMRFNPKKLRQSIINPREESITSLWDHLPPAQEKFTDAKATTLTSFYHKLVMPWLCLLAVIGPAPWCLKFTRQLPVFLIYLVSMLTMVTYYLIMNSAIIIGENQVFSPIIAIGLPFSLYFFFFSWKYYKLS
jgi:lipopolysaccharide export system permease protein